MTSAWRALPKFAAAGIVFTVSRAAAPPQKTAVATSEMPIQRTNMDAPLGHSAAIIPWGYQGPERRLPHYSQVNNGGERGIRTPGTLASSTDFESAAIDHSAISPRSK